MVPIFALSQNYPDEIALARQSCFYDVVVIMARTNISDIVGWHYHGYHGYHWHGMNIFTETTFNIDLEESVSKS